MDRGKLSASLISNNFLHLLAALAALGESRATISELGKETSKSSVKFIFQCCRPHKLNVELMDPDWCIFQGRFYMSLWQNAILYIWGSHLLYPWLNSIDSCWLTHNQGHPNLPFPFCQVFVCLPQTWHRLTPLSCLSLQFIQPHPHLPVLTVLPHCSVWSAVFNRNLQLYMPKSQITEYSESKGFHKDHQVTHKNSDLPLLPRKCIFSSVTIGKFNYLHPKILSILPHHYSYSLLDAPLFGHMDLQERLPFQSRVHSNPPSEIVDT